VAAGCDEIRKTVTGEINARTGHEPEVLHPSWVEEGKVWAGFTTRKGGVSKGRFAELNFSRRWPEDGDQVEVNLSLLAHKEGFDPERVVTAKQVHGGSGLCWEEIDDMPVEQICLKEGDFLVTHAAGVVVGVITADCVPVLLWEPEANCVAAVHAGWRGAVAGVVDNGIRELARRYGARPERMRAAVGPGIGVCCFEVGTEVAEAFVVAFGHEGELVVPHPGKNPHVDLTAAVRLSLARSGVAQEAVEFVTPCTCCSPERFFSFRRDGARIGQHISFVGLRGA
jgi:YfiH family protein